MPMSHSVTQSEILLDVRNVGKRYGNIIAAKDVSFAVPKGVATGLIGPNGAGKTTVFDMLSGQQTSDTGHVRFDGTDVTRLKPHRISRLGLGRTFQSVRVFNRLSVMENLQVADAFGRNRNQPDQSARIRDALAFVEMGPHAGKEAGALSFGQRKLVELAMVLVQDARLILLDEPVAGVHPGLVERLSAILRKLIDSGRTLLLVEHNIPFVTGLCSNIVVLVNGQVLVQGEPSVVVKNPDVLEAFLGTEH
jgi:branched-chain amino acid transport system permease protein